MTFAFGFVAGLIAATTLFVAVVVLILLAPLFAEQGTSQRWEDYQAKS